MQKLRACSYMENRNVHDDVIFSSKALCAEYF